MRAMSDMTRATRALTWAAIASCVCAPIACEAVLGLGSLRFDATSGVAGAGGMPAGTGGVSGPGASGPTGTGASAGTGGSGGSGAAGGTGSTGGSSSAGTGGVAGPGGSGGSGGSPDTTSSGPGGGEVCKPATLMACYSGLPETLGVADCKAGERLCKADGSGFGPCEGEVAPIHETCDDTTDDNCDGVDACSGATLMSETGAVATATPPNLFPSAIAQGHDGSIAVVGAFNGSIAIGNETLVAASKVNEDGGTQSGTDIFVAKFDATGKALWAKRFGDAFDDTPFGVGIDIAGNIFVGGAFEGTLDLGPPVVPLSTVNGGADPESDGFVAKLSPEGAPMAAVAFGDGGTNTLGLVTALAVGPTGSVVVGGTFQGPLMWPASPAETVNGPGFLRAFVAKFDSDLKSRVWGFTIGNGFYEAVAALDVAANGDVALGVHCSSGVYFANGMGGPCGDGNSTQIDLGVAKLNGKGSALWARSFQASKPGSNWVTGVTMSPTGEIAMSAALQNDVIIDSDSLLDSDAAGNGPFDGLLAAFDATGKTLWKKRFGPAQGSQSASAVQYDDGGALFAAGQFVGTIQLGGADLVGDAPSDFFVARLGPADGSVIWEHVHGGFEEDRLGLAGYLNVAAPMGKPMARSRGTRGGVALAIRASGTSDLGLKPLPKGLVIARFAP